MPNVLFNLQPFNLPISSISGTHTRDIGVTILTESIALTVSIKDIVTRNIDIVVLRDVIVITAESAPQVSVKRDIPVTILTERVIVGATETRQLKRDIAINIYKDTISITVINYRWIKRELNYIINREIIRLGKIIYITRMSDVVIDGDIIIGIIISHVMQVNLINIPPGGKLIIDSSNFTATMNGANVLHKIYGEWLFITRETINYRIDAQSAVGLASMSGSVIYDNRYL